MDQKKGKELVTVDKVSWVRMAVCCAVLGLVGAMTFGVLPASAAVDLTSVTIDTTTPETLAATVLTGLGVIWGIRKLIKLINRS